MSITRLQQARQMYAMGQRVAKTLDGSRPGYRGDAAYGPSSRSSQATSIGQARGATGTGGGASLGGGRDRNESPAVDRSSDLQTYNTKIATGAPIGRQDGNQADSTVFYGTPTNTNPSGMINIGYQGPLNTREQALQNFLGKRPEVKLPKWTPTGFLADTFFRKPIQKFADWTTEKNRNFFEDVIRAGRIPGLSFDMSEEELEAAYKSYLSDRLNNKIDAYGNPNPGYDGGGGGAMEGIATLYNNNMFDDTEENDPFVFRYAGEDSTLNPEAAGVNSVAELRDLQLERAKNIYT